MAAHTDRTRLGAGAGMMGDGWQMVMRRDEVPRFGGRREAWTTRQTRVTEQVHKTRGRRSRNRVSIVLMMVQLAWPGLRRQRSQSWEGGLGRRRGRWSRPWRGC